MHDRADQKRRGRAQLWRGARLAGYAVFWWLVAVWILAPEHPSRLFARGLLAAAAVLAGVLAWPNARRALMRFLRRRPRWIDLVSVNAIAVLVLAELAITVLALLVDSPLLVPADARAQTSIRASRYPPGGVHNAHACNSLGFFDDEFRLERTPGVGRIAALADSFGPGVVAYEQNFLTLLDQLLDEPGGEIEVLNFGIKATGPAEYLQLWRVEVAAYEPDLVLVCFFVGNDFVRWREQSLLHVSSLRSVELLRRLWRARDWLVGSSSDHGLMDPEAPTMSVEDYMKVQRERLEVCRVAPTAEVRRRFDETFELLARLCDEVGDRLRVVLIPDELQVDDAHWRELTAEQPGAFGRELPNRELRAFFAQRAVPCLDLLEALRRAQKTAPTYKPRDTHWNARGNEVAAREIAAWLR